MERQIEMLRVFCRPRKDDSSQMKIMNTIAEANLPEPRTALELDARLAATSLAPNERLALGEFMHALHARFGDWTDAVILYGSAARGEVRFAPDATNTFDSDVDLVVVLNREATRDEQSAIRALSHEPQWRHECDLMPLVMTPKGFGWHVRGSSLWLNIQTDGIWLWSRGEVVPTPNRSVIAEQFSALGVYMLTEAQYEEIRIYFERADDDLDTARLLLDSWKERPAIGHCYYAVFYAASALLLIKGITRAKHSGVRSELGRYFFKPRILPPEWSKIYEKLQEEREDATYDLEYEPGEDVAAQRLAWAHEFVDAARDYLIREGYLSA